MLGILFTFVIKGFSLRKSKAAKDNNKVITWEGLSVLFPFISKNLTFSAASCCTLGVLGRLAATVCREFSLIYSGMGQVRKEVDSSGFLSFDCWAARRWYYLHSSTDSSFAKCAHYTKFRLLKLKFDDKNFIWWFTAKKSFTAHNSDNVWIQVQEDIKNNVKGKVPPSIASSQCFKMHLFLPSFLSISSHCFCSH